MPLKWAQSYSYLFPIIVNYDGFHFYSRVSAHVCAAAFNATSLNEVASQVQGAALVHKAGAGTVEVSTFTHEEGVLFRK